MAVDDSLLITTTKMEVRARRLGLNGWLGGPVDALWPKITSSPLGCELSFYGGVVFQGKMS